MRMRVQSEVMAYVREKDPNTALTPWALRSMILTGKIPSVHVGRKRLIDLDTLDDYLSPIPKPCQDIGHTNGVIRPISLAKR